MDEFDQLRTEGEAALIRWIEAKREEGLHLEFKTKASQDENPGRDDKRNLYTALSAFGNAEGGLVVWGMKTGKKGGIDVADSLAPFQNHESFRGRLMDLIQNGVSPPISGVEVVGIDSNVTPGTGYTAVKIPQSGNRPHQAQGGDLRYYRRTSTGTRRMDGYEVRDMILGGTLAKLAIDHTVVSTSRTGNVATLGLQLHLRNITGIMTGYPYMVITQGQTRLGPFEPAAGVRHVHDAVPGTFGLYAAGDVVVHAFDRIPFVKFRFRVAPRGGNRLAFSFSGDRWQEPDDFSILAFDVRFGAERASPERMSLEFTALQLTSEILPILNR